MDSHLCLKGPVGHGQAEGRGGNQTEQLHGGQTTQGLYWRTGTPSARATLPPEVESRPTSTPNALPKRPASVQVSVPRAASVPTDQFLSMLSLFLTQTEVLAVFILFSPNKCLTQSISGVSGALLET